LKAISDKEKILKTLLRETESRISEIKNRISDLENSRNNETKSTAGDKHEVGRAMVQRELESMGKRLTELNEKANFLRSIELKPTDTVRSGSLVETNIGVYFIAIGHGRLERDSETYFVISPASPIGQSMLGKKKGEEFSFNGKVVAILDVH